MYFKYYGIHQTISCWQKGQKWKTINQAGINECVEEVGGGEYSIRISSSLSQYMDFNGAYSPIFPLSVMMI